MEENNENKTENEEEVDIELSTASELIDEGRTVVRDFISDVSKLNEAVPEDEIVLSDEGKQRLQSQYKAYAEKHGADKFDKAVVRKYYHLNDAMHKLYKKSSNAVVACKIITAVLFLILTALLIYAGYRFGGRMLWFSIWIVLIFVDIGVFLMVDYFKDSFKDKVLPYLDDIEKLSFRTPEDEEEERLEEEEEE